MDAPNERDEINSRIVPRCLYLAPHPYRSVSVCCLDHVDAQVLAGPGVDGRHGGRVPHVVHLRADERLRIQRLREHRGLACTDTIQVRGLITQN